MGEDFIPETDEEEDDEEFDQHTIPITRKKKRKRNQANEKKKSPEMSPDTRRKYKSQLKASQFPREFSGELYCANCEKEKKRSVCKTCERQVWKWCEQCKLEGRITGYRPYNHVHDNTNQKKNNDDKVYNTRRNRNNIRKKTQVPQNLQQETPKIEEKSIEDVLISQRKTNPAKISTFFIGDLYCSNCNKSIKNTDLKGKKGKKEVCRFCNMNVHKWCFDCWRYSDPQTRGKSNLYFLIKDFSTHKCLKPVVLETKKEESKSVNLEKEEKNKTKKRKKRKKKVNLDEEEFVMEEDEERNSSDESMTEEEVVEKKPKRKYKKRKKRVTRVTTKEKPVRPRRNPSRKKSPQIESNTETENLIRSTPRKRKRVQRQQDFPQNFSGELYCACCQEEKQYENVDSSYKCKICGSHVWKWCEKCTRNRITGYRSLAGYNNHVCEGNSVSEDENSSVSRTNSSTGEEEIIENGKVVKRRKRRKKRIVDESFVDDSSSDSSKKSKEEKKKKPPMRRSGRRRMVTRKNRKDGALYDAAKILMGFKKAKVNKKVIYNLPREVITVLKSKDS